MNETRQLIDSTTCHTAEDLIDFIKLNIKPRDLSVAFPVEPLVVLIYEKTLTDGSTVIDFEIAYQNEI